LVGPGAASAYRNRPGTLVPPGSKNTAYALQGSPGTWEPLLVSRWNIPVRGPDYQPLARGLVSGPLGAKRQAHHRVAPSEGQRSAARGAQGVAQRHSTREAGELASEDPVEGRALHTGGPREGQQKEHSVAPVAVPITLRDSLRGARSASAEVSRPRCQPVR
jgi:hypothetical protein